MKRTLPVLIAVLALTLSAVTASSAPRDGSDAAASAKKKPILPKSGKYTYVYEGEKHPVKISKKGKRISVTFGFFKGSTSEGGCAERDVKFSNMKLRNPSKADTKYFESGDVAMPKSSDQQDPGAGGGTASVEGELNKRTLKYVFSFSIRMKYYTGVSSCFEFPGVSGKLKKAGG